MENEFLLQGGTIHGRPESDALLVRGDRVAAIGHRDELAAYAGETVSRIDLDGRALLPGFVDAHVHLLHTGLVESGWRIALVDRGREEVLELLGQASRARGRGEWVLAYGWDESGWADRRPLVRMELDRTCPRNPVLAIRRDGHVLTASSEALRRLALSASAPLIDREAGLLREAAAEEALSAVVPDRHTIETALREAAGLCHRMGVTSVHTMSPLREVAALMNGREGRRLRVLVCPEIESLDRLREVGLRTGFGDAWLRFGGLKAFADGSIGAGTAALSVPYTTGGHGALSHETEDLAALLRAAEEAGWQTLIHAIGDRAIDQVLEAHEAARTDRGLRHRIEHCELPHDGHLVRAARLGLCISMQPNFTGNWSGPGRMYVGRLGEERDRGSNPLRRVVDAGLPLALGSDGMPLSPLYGLHWAVNAPHSEQRLTLKEAIDRYTEGGAWFGFEEGSKGRLAPGMLADLVVLDRDPVCAPDRIAQRAVEMTFVGGELVYRRAGEPPIGASG